MSYRVAVRNPLPPGEIVSSGQFGPVESCVEQARRRYRALTRLSEPMTGSIEGDSPACFRAMETFLARSGT